MASNHRPERVALVAGASRGIGAETAKAFARDGYAVVLGARDGEALAHGGGDVVNMASVAGVRATTNLGAYVAGKAGVIALTETVALDYAAQGVRVNVVAPGPILTHHLARAGEESQRLAAGSVPMGR